MNDFKVIILTNNPIAIPGIKEFVFYGKVAAIGIPKRNKEMQHIMENMLKDTDVPVILFTKKEFDVQIKDAFEKYNPDLCFMMTFPFIISPEILRMPNRGFINFHYGLLPQRRGPQPVLWHLLMNDKEAGVTIHKVDEGIDTGDIILQEKIPISETDTYGMLQGNLAFLAAKLAANLLKILSYGSFIPAVAQDESKAEYFNMPDAQRLTVNWSAMTAEEIVRLANACNPWNKAAGTAINNWSFGITEAEIITHKTADEKPGTILACSNEEGLLVTTSDSKVLRINIAYTSEGFLSGGRLSAFGLKKGDLFN